MALILDLQSGNYVYGKGHDSKIDKVSVAFENYCITQLGGNGLPQILGRIFYVNL